jgi:hypothetical protein
VPQRIAKLLLTALLLLAAPLAAAPAAAQDTAAPAVDTLGDLDRNLFLFGGRFHQHWFWDTFIPTNLTYEDNFFIGGGVQQFPWRTGWGVNFGVEIGMGVRFGANEPTSLEGWSGLVTRFDGFELFDRFRVSPSVVLGLSFVTDTIGVESGRATGATKSPTMLVYMAPEIAVTALDNPGIEYFARIQHRSGGLGFIMDFDGSNAVTAGVRVSF